MKKTMKTLASATLSALTLMGAASFTYATDGYVVLSSASLSVGDRVGFANPRTVTFPLPANVSASSATGDRAILQLAVAGSQVSHNEVYLNPPTTVCTSNNTDANQTASIGFLDAHSPALESFTNHLTINSSLLRPGQNNVLMFCARDSAGKVSPGSSVVEDDFKVKEIVLHFKTN